MALDSSNRLARASLGRPRQELHRIEFTEGEPVLVWRAGRRGSLAKVGPCYVVLQRGHTVWVSRRGELWKCNAGQVFKLSAGDQAGLEAIPEDLLRARQNFAMTRRSFSMWSQEVAVESSGPSGGRGDSGADAEHDPGLTDAEQHPEPAEVSV